MRESKTEDVVLLGKGQADEIACPFYMRNLEF